jgi:hypothetical protein
MTFFKEAEDMPPYAMMQMMEPPVMTTAGAYATGVGVEAPRIANARSSRR